jgi:hypothetical protein
MAALKFILQPNINFIITANFILILNFLRQSICVKATAGNAKIYTEQTLALAAIVHSERRLVTGLAIAALMEWKLTVTKATIKARIAERTKTHQ